MAKMNMEGKGGKKAFKRYQVFEVVKGRSEKLSVLGWIYKPVFPIVPIFQINKSFSGIYFHIYKQKNNNKKNLVRGAKKITYVTACFCPPPCF